MSVTRVSRRFSPMTVHLTCDVTGHLDEASKTLPPDFGPSHAVGRASLPSSQHQTAFQHVKVVAVENSLVRPQYWTHRCWPAGVTLVLMMTPHELLWLTTSHYGWHSHQTVPRTCAAWDVECPRARLHLCHSLNRSTHHTSSRLTGHYHHRSAKLGNEWSCCKQKQTLAIHLAMESQKQCMDVDTRHLTKTSPWEVSISIGRSRSPSNTN